MKHPEPQWIMIYKRGEIPACCHTCINYREDGTCEVYKTIPPEDFAQTHKACPEWTDGIPF